MAHNLTHQLASVDQKLSAIFSNVGGVLQSLTFNAPDGQVLDILYQSHWFNGDLEAYKQQPVLLQKLAGEWVGVPFGSVTEDHAGFYEAAPHGLPINSLWQLVHKETDRITLQYNYPEHYPLLSLVRTVSLKAEGKVEFSLAITAREDCAFPVGLHPIFPMDEKGISLTIDTKPSAKGITYPNETEKDVSILATGKPFSSLECVPTAKGGYIDLTHLPLAIKTEEIVQLLGPIANINIHYPSTDLTVTLSWDNELLPDCLLWISNGGREEKPWEGKNYCLGVEPVCSAWDKGPLSLEPNAINQYGHPTVLEFKKNQTLTIHYQLECSQSTNPPNRCYD